MLEYGNMILDLLNNLSGNLFYSLFILIIGLYFILSFFFVALTSHFVEIIRGRVEKISAFKFKQEIAMYQVAIMKMLVKTSGTDGIRQKSWDTIKRDVFQGIDIDAFDDKLLKSKIQKLKLIHFLHTMVSRFLILLGILTLILLVIKLVFVFL